MIIEFTYYMNDHYDAMERNAYISEQTGVPIVGELADKLNNPFYEIELECTLDTETGEIVIQKIVT